MLPLETNPDVMDNALFTSLNVDRVYKLKASHAISLMKLIGYKGLKNQKVFETAFKDIINQVKYN